MPSSPKIKYDKVGQSPAEDDDDQLSDPNGSARHIATSGFIFRVVCIVEIIFSLAVLPTEIFWIGAFMLEGIVGLSLYSHLLASPPAVSRATIGVYFRVKISLVVLALVFCIRVVAAGDSLNLDFVAIVALLGLCLLSCVGICVATKISNTLMDQALDMNHPERQTALPRVTVTVDADDEWEGEQQRLAEFETHREEQLERDLKRAEAMEAEMHREAKQSNEQLAEAEENEMVAALIREGRHEEAAQLKEMICPPVDSKLTKTKTKKKKKKETPVTEQTENAVSAPVVSAPVSAPKPANPLAMFEQEWIAAQFVEERDIEMAFALDAPDVESFLAEADFGCVASGAQQGGLVKSYFSIKFSEIPLFVTSSSDRVLVETLHDPAALRMRVMCKSNDQGAVRAAIAHAESLFSM